MKKYPIRANFDNYFETEKKRKEEAHERNEVVREVLDFINSDISKKKDDIKTYSPQDVAHKINRSTEMVQDIMNELDGGHNGITVFIGEGLSQLDRKSPS